jgi:hypothetical protein
MIIINQGESNTIALTLSEKATIENPNYLFEFYDEQRKVSKFFIAQDTSEYKYRYNKFSITEKAVPNYLNGEVDMSFQGLWTYRIREQESNTNLDPELSGAIVETGKVKVFGPVNEITEYTPPSTPIEVYNG